MSDETNDSIIETSITDPFTNALVAVQIIALRNLIEVLISPYYYHPEPPAEVESYTKR